jgi:hypothetical protein
MDAERPSIGGTPAMNDPTTRSLAPRDRQEGDLAQLHDLLVGDGSTHSNRIA